MMMSLQGDIGLRSMQMITELILDNRKIVERVQKRDIDNVIQLVKEKKVVLQLVTVRQV